MLKAVDTVDAISVSVNSVQVTVQSSTYKLSGEKKNLCVHKLYTQENTALRHNKYFYIATAKKTHEECMLLSKSIRSKTSVPAGSCHSRILDPLMEDICLPVGNCHNKVGYYFNCMAESERRA